MPALTGSVHFTNLLSDSVWTLSDFKHFYSKALQTALKDE